jgi:hypothetical protein
MRSPGRNLRLGFMDLSRTNQLIRIVFMFAVHRVEDMCHVPDIGLSPRSNHVGVGTLRCTCWWMMRWTNYPHASCWRPAHSIAAITTLRQKGTLHFEPTPPECPISQVWTFFFSFCRSTGFSKHSFIPPKKECDSGGMTRVGWNALVAVVLCRWCCAINVHGCVLNSESVFSGKPLVGFS